MNRRLTLRGHRRSTVRPLPLSAVFVAACLLSPPVLGTDADPAISAPGVSGPVCEAPAATPGAESGLAVPPAQRAFFDPDTGQLVVPPPAARRSLALDPRMLEALSTSTAGLAVERRPDGTRVLRLGGRFASPLFGTVALGGDGQRRLTTGHARAAAAAPAPASAGDAGSGGDHGAP